MGAADTPGTGVQQHLSTEERAYGAGRRIGSAILEEFDGSDSIYAAQVGVNHGRNENENEFDGIVAAFDEYCDTDVDKFVYGDEIPSVGRDDVTYGDAFDQEYGRADASFLYVPHASRWRDPEDLDSAPFDGYRRAVDLLEENGLDAVFLADVSGDCDRGMSSPASSVDGIQSRLFGEYGRDIRMTDLTVKSTGETHLLVQRN